MLLFLSIRRLYFIQFLREIYMGKVLLRTFLGAFFWAPIPFKRYNDTFGCGTVVVELVVKVLDKYTYIVCKNYFLKLRL